MKLEAPELNLVKSLIASSQAVIASSNPTLYSAKPVFSAPKSSEA